MRRLISAFPLGPAVMAGALLFASCGAALAGAPSCMRPAEKLAFGLAGLKSELMVVAISCQSEEKYNTFVARFRADLQGEERALTTYFNRAAGRGWQKAHDDYITSLANEQSQDGLLQGTLFCDKHKAMFDEVLGLKDSKDLSFYVSNQNVVQAIDIIDCPPPATKKQLKTANK